MYDGYENKVILIFEGELPSGLEVCVWRDIDSSIWEVSVIDPKGVWNTNTNYDEQFRDARSVLEYMAYLREIKKG